MGEVDLPPEARLRSGGDVPPQPGKTFLYAAGGGFIGALLAIVVARILAGPCCCPDDGERAATAASTLTEFLYDGERTLLA